MIQKGGTMRNLKSLARLLEREERYIDGCGKVRYHRPGLAGAFYWGDKTILTNGYWGVVANGKIEGLTMAQEEGADVEKILFDIIDGHEKENVTDFDNYPPEQVEMLLKCFDKTRKIYMVNRILFIQGKDGYAFIMPNKEGVK